MRVKIRHGATLKCDARCRASFTSYSVLAVVRAQAAEAGWSRAPAWQVYGLRESDHPRRKLDVCPKHAELAVANANKREEVMAARREQRKAERAELRAAKVEVKAAERAQAYANRVAERTARQVARRTKREVEKAQLKADKLEAKVRGAKVHVAKARS